MKIEKDSRGGKTTIRLIGHFQSEHIEELRRQIGENGCETILDLNEVTLVDSDVVRFLVGCKAKGVKIVHCAQYIREWMVRERRVSRGEEKRTA